LGWRPRDWLAGGATASRSTTRVGRRPDGQQRINRSDRGEAECGADLLLSGHLHKTHTVSANERYKTDGHSALIVQAGTATSTRERGETNSFNCLRLTSEDIVIERWQWNSFSKVFELGPTERYLHAANGWHRPR